MESSHFPLQQVENDRPIVLTQVTQKDCHHADIRQDILYDDLQVVEKTREGRSFLKPRFSLHLYKNKLPMKARRSRLNKGKTMGKILSSAAEVHKHKPFSTASSGKSGFFPGVTADNHSYTAASVSWAASLSDYRSTDVRSARLQQLPPCAVIWVEKLIK